MDIKEKALQKHYEWGGKLEVVSRAPIDTREDLSLAYTPGVAQPCLEIQKDINKSYELTRRWNLCAVITDGSAVLGLGDIGPEAGMPVMEGKCVLFKSFGGVDAFPLCVKTKDVDEFVQTVYNISGSFGGINLEDIASPRCFEIERKLKEKCGGEVTVITMGPPMAESTLRECLAVGADKAVLVTDRAFGNADTLATSYSIMSAAATQDSYDMIFCGKESLDGATGQMGAQLAQRFGAAQVTSTLLIKEVNEEAKTAVVERELEDGVETLEVKLPCLFTIEKQNYPARIPNLKGKMAAKKASITTITSNDIPGLDRERIGDAGSPTKVPRMFPPVMPEPGVIVDEGSAEANAAKLLEIMKG